MIRYRGDNIPTIADYSHWNEDAAAIWYEENKYDMQHWDEPFDAQFYEDERYYEDYLDPDICAEVNDYHQNNTSGRTIQFAGIEVYDQQDCSDCGIALSEPWPRIS
jgi:hypothetical protein